MLASASVHPGGIRTHVQRAPKLSHEFNARNLSQSVGIRRDEKFRIAVEWSFGNWDLMGFVIVGTWGTGHRSRWGKVGGVEHGGQEQDKDRMADVAVQNGEKDIVEQFVFPFDPTLYELMSFIKVDDQFDRAVRLCVVAHGFQGL